MSHMYGNATITVTGPQELLEKAGKILREFTIDENVVSQLKDQADRWDHAVSYAKPNPEENNNKTIELQGFYDIMGVALMPFETVVSEIPELAVTISGDIADSVTDEAEDFFVEHPAGKDDWEYDDWVFDAARIW